VKSLSIPGLLLGLLLAAPSPSVAATVNAIAAVVNDELITTLQVEREAAVLAKESEKRGGALSDAARAELRKDALNRIIERKLVEQKIKELGITVSEEEIRQAVEDVKKQNKLTQEALITALTGQGLSYEQYKAQLREQLERIKLMSQEVKGKIQVSEREIEEQYQANQKQYGEDERFRARHIFFKTKKEMPENERKAVWEKAAKVLALAREGRDFVALAKEYSEDPGAVTDGGDLGTFKRDEMLPEIAGVVTKMKAGDVSEIITSSAGLHILRLEEVITARVKALEKVRAEIEESLYRKKSEERFNQWASDLRKGAAIDIKR
jgi:peptidyl-prolyl cis-trans isomerase SurA